MLLSATADFCTRFDKMPIDEIEDTRPELVTVRWEGSGPPASSENLVRLVLGYVVKVSPNFAAQGAPALAALWSEMNACSGGSYQDVGPDFLEMVTTDLPAPVTKSFQAELRQKYGRVFVISPYKGRGGEAYYSPLAAFAIIRSARTKLGSEGWLLDTALARLCAALDRGEFDPKSLRDVPRSSAVADGVALTVFTDIAPRPLTEDNPAGRRRPAHQTTRTLP